jgi:hypothetical protein
MVCNVPVYICTSECFSRQERDQRIMGNVDSRFSLFVCLVFYWGYLALFGKSYTDRKTPCRCTWGRRCYIAHAILNAVTIVNLL